MIINHPVITEHEEFHGFRTVHFFEAECAKAGQTTRRIPGHMADGTPAFAILTLCPTENPASYDGLDILTADEAHCLYSGCIRHDGSTTEKTFASIGFIPTQRLPLEAEAVEQSETEGVETSPTLLHQDDLVQLSLFSI